MRVIYITRASLSASGAQARQILSMAQAYHDRLAGQFLLISPGGLSGNPPFAHRPLPWSAKQWQRYIRACLAALSGARAERSALFVTRDIVVAFCVIFAGGQVVYEAHDQPHGWLPKTLFRLLNRAGRFKMTTNCLALAEHYRKVYGFSEANLLPAHNAAFPEAYAPLRALPKAALRQRLNLPADTLLVVHTGSLYKGGAELFEYLARGREQITFVHVGGKDGECAVWRDYYRDRGLSNVHFVPHRPAETIREYQVAADLLFYMTTRHSPIYWCTSPLKLFEYMASGTPILGARIGSIGEVFDDSVGFCFDPEQSAGIEAGFAAFLSDPAAAARRAANALSAAEQRYSWHRRAEAILQFAGGNF
ncbi:glycosyltransferase family 4 protein [Methylomonas sp. CM2]|uniref:glycosyltransferase family 4 protein n=1 Tax=Methylomonas sp. CM2 TaxID=3417647 RepID=UPI003CECB28F